MKKIPGCCIINKTFQTVFYSAGETVKRSEEMAWERGRRWEFEGIGGERGGDEDGEP